MVRYGNSYLMKYSPTDFKVKEVRLPSENFTVTSLPIALEHRYAKK